MLTNAKSFTGEECTPQHRLLVNNFWIRVRKTWINKPYWKRRLWNLKNPGNQQKFINILVEASDEREEESGIYSNEKLITKWFRVYVQSSLFRRLVLVWKLYKYY